MTRIKYKEIAGLEIKRGNSAINRKPENSVLKKLYIKESRSVRNIASIIGYSKGYGFSSIPIN